jgi:hypothetical protein
MSSALPLNGTTVTFTPYSLAGLRSSMACEVVAPGVPTVSLPGRARAAAKNAAASENSEGAPTASTDGTSVITPMVAKWAGP